jgi:tetratricopeptide (TPR) repeat protein
VTSLSPITALRVANEAFLVASTIDRCPKVMMLRELVMNALEAAAQNRAGVQTVCIGAKLINGVNKLSIWNTGRGMSAPEIHQICDLAASLYKENSLDKNFGMGAKVASLPSNKLGLRYRSCHNGVVSEVTLIQHDGVYGRHRYDHQLPGVDGEVADVTTLCQTEGGYDLSHDWTEVTLFGNQANQNTLIDPYNGDPSMPENWLAEYMTSRFFRLPEGVRLEMPQPFIGIAGRVELFDRYESVKSLGGVVIHYGYTADLTRMTAPLAADGLPNFAGQISIVYRNEVYGLRRGQEWLLDAPVYGFPFAGRHCSVFIELPDDYGVRPEVYRQFLRFTTGDQRQVFTQDFSALVRTSVPLWLQEIIASFGQPRHDYITEVSDELQALLIQLGVAAEQRQASLPRGAETGQKESYQNTEDTKDVSANDTKKLPLPTVFEKPPEIITIRDEMQVDERELQGRVARYYPQTHQLFINLTYSAVTRLAAQLENDFASSPDAILRAQAAEDIGSWIVTRQVARALAYTLAKKTAGWTPEEVSRARSPEALSVVADDYLALLGSARRRMAETLNMQIPLNAEALSSSGQAIWALRSSGELADAEQAARRAMATPNANVAPLLRQISSIEQQRGNSPAAMKWARQAVETKPEDPHNRSHLAGLLQQQGQFIEAEAEIVQALALLQDKPAWLLIRHSEIKQALGEHEAALTLAREAIEADPTAVYAYITLANHMIAANKLNEAEKALEAAKQHGKGDQSHVLRQLSVIAQRRQNLPLALEYAHAAVAANPTNLGCCQHLSNLLLEKKEFDAAEQAVRRALALNTGNPSPLLRQLSSIERQRGNLPAALDWGEQSLDCNPADIHNYQHLVDLLTQLGRLTEAAELVQRGLKLEPPPGAAAHLLRQLSNIEQKRQNMPEAIQLAREALAVDSSSGWNQLHLAEKLSHAGQLDEAKQLTLESLADQMGQPSRLMRQLSIIEARNSNLEEAVEWAEKAVALDPADPWGMHHLSNLYLQLGELEKAEETAHEGLAGGAMPARFQHQLSMIEVRQRNLPAAINWARQSIESEPNDPWGYHHLSCLYHQQGQLDEALEAATEALRLSTGGNLNVFRHDVDNIRRLRMETNMMNLPA